MPSPYPNRPPIAVEPLTLGSGDIEAVEYAPRHAQPQPMRGLMTRIPPAAMQQPRVPSPSPSLAPVAMSAHGADATGPQRSIETVVLRSSPSMKMGFSILMAGAIVGSILGITLHPKQAIAYQPATTENVLGAAAEDEAPPPAATALPTAAKKDEAAKDKDEASKDAKEAKDDDAKEVVAKPASKKGRRVAAVAAPSPAAPKPAKAAKAAAADKDDDDGDYRVASATSDSETKKEPKKTAKAALASRDEDDAPAAPAPAKTGKKPRASDDAVNVLKAAMGATENTL